MKSIARKAASCIIVSCLILVTLYRLSGLMQRKESDYKYIPFFEHASDYDVLFLGTSHMINAVLPLELWHNYGITSYNLGGHSNEIATTYWVLENALDYASPKAVVIDCYQLGNMQKASGSFEYVHLSLDAFPLTLTKLRAAADLLDDTDADASSAASSSGTDIAKAGASAGTDSSRTAGQEMPSVEAASSESRSMLGLLWDFSVYHARWKELGKPDFEPEATIEYGAESRISLTSITPPAANHGKTLKAETTGMQYLDRIIRTCRNRNIDVILTSLPYSFSETDDWQEINSAAGMAAAYDIPFINFFDVADIRYSTDFHDPASHLNVSGAQKITEYLGSYLRNTMKLPDHRSDSTYRYWNDDYALYSEMKENRLAGTEDLRSFLLQLEDQGYGFVISAGDPALFQDDIICALLKDKGFHIADITESTRYLVSCGRHLAVINTEITGNGVYGTDGSSLGFFFSGEGNYGVYADDQEMMVMPESTLGAEEGQILVSVFRVDDAKKLLGTYVFSRQEQNAEDQAAIFTQQITKLQ